MTASFLLDGRAIDWILGLVAIEAVALLALRAIRGRGPASLSLLGNLLSGAFLLIALRGALTGGSPATLGLCLALALAAHLADLFARWDHPKSAERGPSMRATLSLRVTGAQRRLSPGAGRDEPPAGK